MGGDFSARPEGPGLTLAYGHGLKSLSDSYFVASKKIWYLFLYSFKNLTNGIKPTIKAVLEPFYGRCRLIDSNFRENRRKEN